MPLSISHDGGLPGVTGQNYWRQWYAGGGTEPYVFDISVGSVPTGLILSSGGILTGTPTVAGVFNFTVRVTDAVSSTDTVNDTITVYANQVLYMSLPPGYKNSAYSFQFTDAYADSVFTFVWGAGEPPYTYGPLLWSGVTLGGLTITPGGLLSGTPNKSSRVLPTNPNLDFNASLGIQGNTHFLSPNLPLHTDPAVPPPCYLTVNKVVIPGLDPGLFDLQIDAVTQVSNQGNGGTTGAILVTAGMHTVGETAGSGTDLADYTVIIGGDVAPDGSVTVLAGESKVGVITNIRVPSSAFKSIPIECFYLRVQNPEDINQVTIDWLRFLGAGDAIASVTWPATAGVVVDSVVNTTTKASVSFSIPAAVTGETYYLTCQVVTELGITDLRSIQIDIRAATGGTHAGTGWWRV